MSAILAIVGAGAAEPGHDLNALLASMSRRGSDVRAVWRGEGATLGAARDDWEMDECIAGTTLIGERPSLRVVCDATLYYRSDLKRTLLAAGVTAASDSAADLIVAAYEAFGAGCVDHLEGDYAFCVWDHRHRTLFCARDPFGSRSLFHTVHGTELLVASTPHPLVRRRGPSASFDPVGVVRSVLMRYGDGTSTAWSGVKELPAGHTFTVTAGRGEVTRFWHARGSSRWTSLTASAAVETLRDLLGAACRERASPGGTSLALSGGQDSTAILASLPISEGLPIHLLSFRFPVGDPGDEAWYVNRAAAHVGLPVSWVEIAQLELYADPDRRALARSHCHGNVFEGHNRELARHARHAGDRVLLNGHGGDNLLGVGNWQMADLLRRGRLLQLRRYRSARGYHGARHFLDHCLRPALPLSLLDRIEPVIRRRLCTRPYERPVPAWFDAAEQIIEMFVREDRLEYGRTIVSGRPTVTEQRRAWGLMDPGFARSCAASFDLNRDEGVELRMPYYDRRLVDFVMSRPPEEFNQPNEYKVIMRRAMEGRLPARTRAPQAGGLKPGTAVGVMQTRYPVETAEMISTLAADEWILERLGVLKRGSYLEACGGSSLPHWWSAVDVSLPLFAEIWLRANSPTPLHGTDSRRCDDPTEMACSNVRSAR